MNIYDNKDFFDSYSQMSRSVYGLSGAGEWQTLEPLFPPLEGKNILDLGCGYGWHAKYAADKGAVSVTAIDGSEKMINMAKIRNSHEKIAYSVQNIEDFAFENEKYDVVISNLVLHYIDDLTSVYKNVLKTLTKGGTFLFNIEHPTFTAGVGQSWAYDENGNIAHWPVDNYYITGQRETDFLGHSVKKYHHTLTQIIMGLIECGFEIKAVVEAGPPENMMDIPGMKDELRRPMMLIVKAEKV
ncbi:MAG: class I SAM-dependent methyltransferase [Clostridia bacterium]|nr:class I SAM-dependent methyltransferase [Clostridia bacterium]